MEQKKIGNFIAQQRKEKQMTQKQLGEALGISDKTVSKWECGNGLPDISNIMPLCNILEINVNELISITWIAATIVFIISLSLAAGRIHIGWYFDLYGIMAMVFLPAVSLHIPNSLKDFGSAFVYLFRNENNITRLENAVYAIDIAEKTLFTSSIFLSLFYLVMLLWTGANEELEIITINTVLYGILGIMVLIPVKGRLKKTIRNIQ